MDKVSFGNFIKERRKKLGITQSEIASFFNVSIQAISRWENGFSYPDFTILGELANFLKISINDLLDLKNSDEEYLEDKQFNYKTFGKNIKKYQKKLKLSQKELAEIASLSQSTISSIINGKTYPTINQFIIISKTFNVNYHDLYYSVFIDKDELMVTTKKSFFSFKYSYIFSIVLLFLLFSGLLTLFHKNSNQINYNYIEFWDENNQMIGCKKLNFGEYIYDYPNCPTFLGWNKTINIVKTSTIYKANKNPFELLLRVHYGGGDISYYSYDKISDFNIYDINTHVLYCTSLSYIDGTPFKINNIAKGQYDLYATMEQKSIYYIYFPSEFNLNPIMLYSGDKVLNQLPIICNDGYLIKGWKYKNQEITKNLAFAFNKNITLEPIYHNQTTTINDDGLITYLSSNEESIIIPDTINNISVTGIANGAIHLNEINNKLIFMNRTAIKVQNVFSNTGLLDNIKELELYGNSFHVDSFLGNISSLSRVYIDEFSLFPNSSDIITSATSSNRKYSLSSISTNKDFYIDKLEYYETANNFFKFDNLSVNEVFCLDKKTTSLVANMFENSTLKKIHFTGHLLTDGNMKIFDSSFKNCKNLESFDFSNNTYISGNNQFFDCINLKNITFYGNIDNLSDNMFYNTKIDKLIINKNVANIQKNALKNTIIKEIYIDNVLSIEKYCYLPSSLKDFYLGGQYSKPNSFTNIPKNIKVHYLSHNNNDYDKLKTALYKICVNCTHLHKGK